MTCENFPYTKHVDQNVYLFIFSTKPTISQGSWTLLLVRTFCKGDVVSTVNMLVISEAAKIDELNVALNWKNHSVGRNQWFVGRRMRQEHCISLPPFYGSKKGKVMHLI